MKEFKIRKINIVTIIFPAIIMILIAVLSFSNMRNNFHLDWKGILIISMILGFPLLFFIQGIMSSISKTNIVLSLGISLVTFLMILIIFLNDSALLYALIYLIAGVIGYGIGYISLKIKSKY